MKYKSYSNEEVKKAIQQSLTIAKALQKLNLKVTGGNYGTIYKLIKKLNIDTSHLLGKKINTGKTREEIFGPSRPLKEILIKGGSYQSVKLKKRLIKEKLLKNECCRCGISKWQGEDLSLHIDHINGDSSDNRLENLRILCPNCHSLTPTYCGRNVKSKRKNYKFPKIKKSATLCINCKNPIYRKATRCKSCAGKYHQTTKINWPTIEELIKLVTNSSYVTVGKKLGVSDNAVRKHIKRHS